MALLPRPLGNVPRIDPETNLITPAWSLYEDSLDRAVRSGTIGTTTNDSAAAGVIGEYVSSVVLSGSAISLVNSTTADISFIDLTAGDWDVRSIAYFLTGAATNVTYYAAGISIVSATFDTTPGRFGNRRYAAHVPGAAAQDSIEVPSYRMSLASSTRIYHLANCAFTVSTMTAHGIISARRVR